MGDCKSTCCDRLAAQLGLPDSSSSVYNAITTISTNIATTIATTIVENNELNIEDSTTITVEGSGTDSDPYSLRLASGAVEAGTGIEVDEEPDGTLTISLAPLTLGSTPTIDPSGDGTLLSPFLFSLALGALTAGPGAIVTQNPNGTYTIAVAGGGGVIVVTSADLSLLVNSLPGGYDISLSLNGLDGITATRTGTGVWEISGAALNNAILILQGDVTALEAAMLTAQANIATLQTQMVTAQADIDALELAMTAANTNIATLQGQMITAQGNIASLQTDVGVLQADMIGAQADIATLQGQMATAQLDIDALEAAMVAAQGSLATLQGQMATALADIATLQGQMLTAQANIIALQGAVATLQTDMTAAQGDIASLQGSVALLQTDMTGAEADILALQGDVGALQMDVGTLQTDMSGAQAAILALQASVGTLQADMTAAEADILTLQGQVGVLQTDVSTLQGQVATLQTQVTTLQTDVGVLQTQVTTLQTQVNNILTGALQLAYINAGTNVTVSGLGTQLNPYIISSTAAAGITPVSASLPMSLQGDLFLPGSGTFTGSLYKLGRQVTLTIPTTMGQAPLVALLNSFNIITLANLPAPLSNWVPDVAVYGGAPGSIVTIRFRLQGLSVGATLTPVETDWWLADFDTATGSIQGPVVRPNGLSWLVSLLTDYGVSSFIAQWTTAT